MYHLSLGQSRTGESGAKVGKHCLGHTDTEIINCRCWFSQSDDSVCGFSNPVRSAEQITGAEGGTGWDLVNPCMGPSAARLFTRSSGRKTY